MSRKQHQRQASRRKLKEHDAGRNRHNKWLNEVDKDRRAEVEHKRVGMKRKPPKEKQLTYKEIAEVNRRRIEEATRRKLEDGNA